ncbi:MAG: aspartate 1-decarboxylase [Chloroflexi bacterium]|nr:aspartate 1-decarboxylase [Chloroflexota bacterium]
MRIMLKSKIHRARVTEVNLDYEGSIAIDQRLLEEADILPYEQVQVLNVNNGARFATYAIEGTEDSGDICINGAAARLAAKGDTVIILTYRHLNDEEARDCAPTVVSVNENNQITGIKREVKATPL